MLDLLKGGKTDVVTLRLAQIRTDGGTQMRAELNQATIAEYAEAMLSGARFPPAVVYYDGADYWLGDGFHRLAARKDSFIDIECEVRSGTRRDAVLCAAGANANHGLRRTNADKRRAVEALLRDEEWSAWSDRAIAEACRVTHPLVAKVRAELSGNDYQIAERTVQRGESTYAQKTEGIRVANQRREIRHRTTEPQPQPYAEVKIQPANQPAPPGAQGKPDERIAQAQEVIARFVSALEALPTYGVLTGKFAQPLPAERALRAMRDELTLLIETLSQEGKP